MLQLIAIFKLNRLREGNPMACWILSVLMCAAVGADADCTIVHFTANWCEPCKQIEPALAQLQSEGWVVRTIDVDQQPELVKQFRIENLPTLAILCRQQEVDRMVGAVSYERIRERALRAAARNQSGAAPRQTQPQQQPQSGPIVRGQSPGLNPFPMLATAPALAAAGHLASGQLNGIVDGSSREATSNAQPAFNTIPASAQPQPISQQTTLTIEQAIARAAAATVRIRVDEANTTAYGTGTIVDVRGQEALILTCGHLFRDMQPNSQLTIDLFPGTAQETNLPSELIDFKAEGEDIGLISFRLPTHIDPVPILARGEPVSIGQPAFSFGCDRGANPTRRDTQIKSINRYLGADNIEIVGAPVLGRSGGGLFDTQGRLIGVCNAANPEDDEGIYAAADVVYTQIERLGLSELFEGSQPTVGLSPNLQLASNPVVSNPVSANPSGGWQQAAGGQPLSNQPLSNQSPSNQSPSDPSLGNPTVVTASATEPLRWPDESATMPNLESPKFSSHGPAPSGSIAGEVPVTASNTRQIICIVRDSGGQDRVVTIDAPPDHLLQMIQQSSRK